uniref:Hairy-related 8.2 n=1 Tax=Hippocampus comes TaxID=109280 RepID=A0A3Q2ZIC6_HIPCM
MTATSMARTVGKHTSAKEERKMRKPLIERKRRERINNCLDQLKEAVISAFRLDQSKLEKADILEMTVKHLQNIQTTKVNGKILCFAQQRYSTGYIQCMQEVHNMLLTCDWMDKTLGSRLLNHLLRSLPRSTEDHAVQPTARNDVPTLVSQDARPQRTTISREQTSHHVSAVSRRQERVDQPSFLADPLEAQQRYSTGYIQCMQEVHNMLLTCDWMDKTLGSRLLNHLLRSLPRSTEEHAAQPTARNDVPTLVSQDARPQRMTRSIYSLL